MASASSPFASMDGDITAGRINVWGLHALAICSRYSVLTVRRGQLTELDGTRAYVEHNGLKTRPANTRPAQPRIEGNAITAIVTIVVMSTRTKFRVSQRRWAILVFMGIGTDV